KGDTLWELAKRYRTTMDDIIKLNELEDPDSLVPGQKLLIPGRAM
ncbi:LysM domain-containing protein, partial [Clostridium baratii]